MSNVDLNAIVNSIVSGDHNAFRIFYDLYYLKIYRFVHYFLSDRQACELVISDIFCIVWEKRNLLLKVKNIDAYLYQISRNEAYHYIEKRKKNAIVSIDDITGELPDIVASVEDEMMEKEMMQVYRLAVDKLPERCRMVFLMVREQKLSHKEVADMLDITPGTIEIQMNIAIKKISKVIKNYYPKLFK